MATTVAQFRCDNNVLTDYFAGVGMICNEASLRTIISKLMQDIPDRNVYIGVTHHPCGRFSGSYSKTAYLPADLPYEYSFSENMIQERAHYLDYDRMYLICYTQDKQQIFDNESLAISIAKEIDVTRVENTTAGGNGKVTGSEIYWLYVCISNKILS